MTFKNWLCIILHPLSSFRGIPKSIMYYRSLFLLDRPHTTTYISRRRIQLMGEDYGP